MKSCLDVYSLVDSTISFILLNFRELPVRECIQLQAILLNCPIKRKAFVFFFCFYQVIKSKMRIADRRTSDSNLNYSLPAAQATHKKDALIRSTRPGNGRSLAVCTQHNHRLH
jgi:hypothetical protein